MIFMMMDWANELKGKASGALGAVGALLNGVGPPWALDVLKASWEGDVMGALEAMLRGRGVALDFAPGGVGFVAYHVLEKLLRGDGDGARSDVVGHVGVEPAPPLSCPCRPTALVHARSG